MIVFVNGTWMKTTISTTRPSSIDCAAHKLEIEDSSYRPSFDYSPSFLLCPFSRFVQFTKWNYMSTIDS